MFDTLQFVVLFVVINSMGSFFKFGENSDICIMKNINGLRIVMCFLTCIILNDAYAGNEDSLSYRAVSEGFRPIEKKSKIGWEVSGNFGVYQANKYHAKFYNGAPQNVNNLNFIFSNYYWYQDIKDQIIIHAQRDSFLISDYPADIKYDASMHVGFSARYNFSEEITMNISFNYSKLQVRDVIALEVIPPFSGAVESYVYCNLFGIEGRTNIDVGGLYTFSPEKDMTPFAEMGLNVNSTHVKKHMMQLYDREFNMVNIYGSSNYVPGAPLNEYDIRQGGIGFGTYISGGMRYALNDQFSMELAAIIYLKTVGLENYSKKFGLHGAALIRLVFSPFFNFSGEDGVMEK